MSMSVLLWNGYDVFLLSMDAAIYDSRYWTFCGFDTLLSLGFVSSFCSPQLLSIMNTSQSIAFISAMLLDYYTFVWPFVLRTRKFLACRKGVYTIGNFILMITFHAAWLECLVPEAKGDIGVTGQILHVVLSKLAWALLKHSCPLAIVSSSFVIVTSALLSKNCLVRVWSDVGHVMQDSCNLWAILHALFRDTPVRGFNFAGLTSVSEWWAFSIIFILFTRGAASGAAARKTLNEKEYWP